MAKVELSLAVGIYDRTFAIFDGRVPVDGRATACARSASSRTTGVSASAATNAAPTYNRTADVTPIATGYHLPRDVRHMVLRCTAVRRNASLPGPARPSPSLLL